MLTEYFRSERMRGVQHHQILWYFVDNRLELWNKRNTPGVLKMGCLPRNI